MNTYQSELTIKGKKKKLDTIEIDGHEIIIQGKWFKTAMIKEEWDDDVESPERIIKELRKSGEKIDIFTFMQRLPESHPKYDYPMEWDNCAAIPIKNYEHWLWNQLHENPRNKLRKSMKSGIVVKQVEFNEEFVRSIMEILNEAPFRQGHPFWDYGKDFQTVWREHVTYLDRSDFIGVYNKYELIGYLKLVYAGRFTRTMQILSKISHRDKGPTNALLAKAVEICAERGIPFLVYGKYSYGKVGSNTLKEFKHYNGFEHILLPRYYVPLTIWGQCLLKLNLHAGVVGILPRSLIKLLLAARTKWYQRKEIKMTKTH